MIKKHGHEPLSSSFSLFPSTVNSREKKHPSWRGFKGVCVVRSGGARSARNPILDEKARGRWLRSVEKFLPLKRWDFIEGELYLPTFFAIPPLAPFSQRPHCHVSMSPLSTLLLLASSSLFCLIFLIYLIFFFFFYLLLCFSFSCQREKPRAGLNTRVNPIRCKCFRAPRHLHLSLVDDSTRLRVERVFVNRNCTHV